MLILILVFAPFLFAALSYAAGKKKESLRDHLVLFFTMAELFAAVVLFVTVIRNGAAAGPGIGRVFTAGISFTTDGFRAVYALVTALMWAFTTWFSMEYFREERRGLNHYYAFVLMTLGATEGVMLSGDLMTTFLFFEILSLTSFTWVIHEETPGAVRAAYTYLFVAVIGGLVLFMGLVLLQSSLGTLSFGELKSALEASGEGQRGRILAAGVCILLGFGAKAGMFPVHIWLPKAHPVAPSPGSALLSGVLTKVGIYGILMTTLQVFAGDETFGWIVLILGTVTMFLGALLALFSVNLKRTLACSSMSQIGFILVGTGMMVLLTCAGDMEGAAETLGGAMLHMVNHSMLKLCLFCAAGVVVMNLHELELNKIRGFGRNKLLFKAAFFLGLVGISGVPLFNGYASKTLLHEGIVMGAEHLAGCAGILHAIEWIFLISGGCTFAYMLKLFICLFVEKNEDPEKQKRYDGMTACMNVGSSIVVFGTSLLFPVLGQKPVFGWLAGFMTGEREVLHHFRPLSWECISGGLISLGIGAFLYLVLIRRVLMKDGRYVNLWPEKLDLEDLLYRPLLTRWLPGAGGAVARFLDGFFTRPFFTRDLFSCLKGLARFLEGLFTRPLFTKWIPLCFAVIGRALETSVDAFVVLMRRTMVREKTAAGKKSAGAGQKLLRTTEEALSPVVGNFSFALMLSCIGIVVILGVLVLFIL